MNILEAEKIKMPFGRYRDFTLGEIAAKDVLYFAWLEKQEHRDTYLRDAIGVVTDKHRETIRRKQAAGEKPKLFDQRATSSSAPRPIQQKLF